MITRHQLTGGCAFLEDDVGAATILAIAGLDDVVDLYDLVLRLVALKHAFLSGSLG